MQNDASSLADILDALILINRYMQDVSREAFEENIEKQDAVIRRLTIIGEATKRLSKEFRAQHPDIPWKKIAGMRDVLSHDYDEVDFDEVWNAICNDLPALSAYIQPLLPTEK